MATVRARRLLRPPPTGMDKRDQETRDRLLSAAEQLFAVVAMTAATRLFKRTL